MSDSPEAVLERLAASEFRRRFRLGARELEVVARIGSQGVETHARELLLARVAAAAPRNDGRQTPMRGHPVFIAQHATATCCRRCIGKWHGIPAGEPIAPADLDRLVGVVLAWIARQIPTSTPAAPFQPRLL